MINSFSTLQHFTWNNGEMDGNVWFGRLSKTQDSEYDNNAINKLEIEGEPAIKKKLKIGARIIT